jgi:hypothetical protein
MTCNPFLQVRSAKFRVLPGEDDDLGNEGMYGKSLAQYLQVKSEENGYQTPCVVCEDWGWWVEIAEVGFPCGLGVYGLRTDDSDELDIIDTVLAPKGKKWSWRRFGLIDTTQTIERLHGTMKHILNSDKEVSLVCESPNFPLESRNKMWVGRTKNRPEVLDWA